MPQPRPRCEHTTEEGYLESYGFGYAIVFGLIILFLNGLLGILLALIGMVSTKKPRGRWWSFYAILVHVSPWLLCGAYVLLGAWFGGSWARIAPIDGPRVGLGVGVFLAHRLRLVVI